MGLSEAIYGACSVAFLALVALTVLRRRVSGPGLAIVCACGLTAAWAAYLAVVGPQGESALLDSLRLSAWLFLLVTLIGMRDQRRDRSVYLLFGFTIGCGLVAVFSAAMILLIDGVLGDAVRRLNDFLRVGIAIAGMLAAENLLRNAADRRRRDIWPLCLALGAVFAFELFVYADRLMMPQASPIVAAGRGLVELLAVPLLALAMARNRDWRVDIHVSRTLVLHTATLVASGLFFLSLAAVGFLVRKMGGAWGPLFQLLSLLGSAVVLVAVMGSHDLRVRLKRFIAQHFFSHRFDYRAEWLRFVDTVSQPDGGGDTLQVRVVRALAQIVDSPAGSLWCLQEGRGYVAEAGWKMQIERGQSLSLDDPFISAFRDGAWIQQQSGQGVGKWPFDPARTWLAIPLSHGGQLIAFIILTPPPRGYRLDWEAFDLLRAAGRQAASYIAEEHATRALLDSRVLNEYSKRFAFVVHDIKNLASQLSLVVSNARRYIEDPEFRADMLQTLDDSVARMNRLIAQLHGRVNGDAEQVIEPDLVIANLCRELSRVGKPFRARLQARNCKVAINDDQFRSVLSHLINNAREAAQSAEEVIVSSRHIGDRIMIDVVDTGPGMDAEFIKNELFRPFRSTKPGGLGIGGYQIRELLRGAGGELEVISEKGMGTIMRLTFPMHGSTQLMHSAV